MIANKKKFYTILFIGYMALVFTVSSIPNLKSPQFLDDKISADKIAHCIQYFIFAFLYFQLRMHQKPTHADKKIYSKFILIEIFFIGCLISYFDELHQIPIGRQFSWWDMLADLVGFYTFILIVKFKH